MTATRDLHADFARREVELEFDFLVGMPDAETEEGREGAAAGDAPADRRDVDACRPRRPPSTSSPRTIASTSTTDNLASGGTRRR